MFWQRLKPTNPTAQKALTTPTHYKLTPRPATRVRPKALTSSGASKSQLFDGLDDDEPSLTNGAFIPRYASPSAACTVAMVTGKVLRYITQLNYVFIRRLTERKGFITSNLTQKINSAMVKWATELHTACAVVRSRKLNSSVNISTLEPI